MSVAETAPNKRDRSVINPRARSVLAYYRRMRSNSGDQQSIGVFLGNHQ
jgi:hypothetical protein